MTAKIFAIATFVLLAWLASTQLSATKNIQSLEARIATGMTGTTQALAARISTLEKNQQANHKSLLNQLDSIEIDVPTVVNNSSSSSEELNQLKSQLTAQNKFSDLKLAYRQVMEAEIEKLSATDSAADKLLASKEPIWKSSLEYPEATEALQNLMGPIDILASQWKNGDTTGTVQDVYKVLQQTMANLDADI